MKDFDKKSPFITLLRFTMSGIMLWAFFDKVFGLGFATMPESSWLSGVSPTQGFLTFGTKGKFLAEIFQAMSGNIIVDMLFMGGLLGIGTSLLVGAGVKIAGYSGALMMFLMWLSLYPPVNNPVLDEHIVYLFVFLMFSRMPIGYGYGIRSWWSKTSVVKRFPVLE